MWFSDAEGLVLRAGACLEIDIIDDPDNTKAHIAGTADNHGSIGNIVFRGVDLPDTPRCRFRSSSFTYKRI